MEHNEAIDSYEPHLVKCRAANDTTASPFEEGWKNKRTRELAAEDDEVVDQPPRQLTGQEGCTAD